MAEPVVSLLRWLGPWAAKAPTRSTRDELRFGPDGRVRAYLYRSARTPLAAYLLSPGLHFNGPDDPRIDRLGRIFADAGFITLAPFIPDHMALRVGADAPTDLMTAFDGFEAITRREGLPRPAIFSFSFGTYPSVRLCADPRYAHRVQGLFLFGGYAEFARVCRFASTGEVEVGGRYVKQSFDPTNVPAVFMNFSPHFALSEEHRALLDREWFALCRETWTDPKFQSVEAIRPLGERRARELPAEIRQLFLQGCGLASGTGEVMLEALPRAMASMPYTDVSEAMGNVKCPVVIAHGRDDKVIHYEEAGRLRALLPPGHPHRFFLTGMFGHAAANLPSLKGMAVEARTMLRMVRAMAALPTGRLQYEPE